MEIGIGLDARLGLGWDEQRELVRQAAGWGYASAWTPAAAAGRDAFHTCVQWSQASAAVRPGGLATGILVVPAPTWTAPTLASQAATVGAGEYQLHQTFAVTASHPRSAKLCKAASAEFAEADFFAMKWRGLGR